MAAPTMARSSESGQASVGGIKVSAAVVAIMIAAAMYSLGPGVGAIDQMAAVVGMREQWEEAESLSNAAIVI